MERIKSNRRLFNGKPTIRNTGVLVETVLSLLACGIKEEQILEEYSELEAADIAASVEFAYQQITKLCNSGMFQTASIVDCAA